MRCGTWLAALQVKAAGHDALKGHGSGKELPRGDALRLLRKLMAVNVLEVRYAWRGMG